MMSLKKTSKLEEFKFTKKTRYILLNKFIIKIYINNENRVANQNGSFSHKKGLIKY